MKNFALVGAAGYVAPRHMRAIQDTGNYLLAAVDKHDCVGIMDSYFPKASFFTEIERFDRHLSKLKSQGEGIDYLSVCSPNYLHDSHIRFGLRMGADVICEKPLVLNPWNLDALREVELETGQQIYTILQLRLHPAIIAVRDKVNASKRSNTKHKVNLTYITSRGNWYYTSWKGSNEKSGGIGTNIGIHFFDMLCWIFGGVQESMVHVHTHDRASGFMELEHAEVSWFLSINEETIPEEVRERGAKTFRSITVDGDKIEFSGGFTDLHTASYQSILDGNGFTLEEAGHGVRIAFDIRNAKPVGLTGNHHPLAELPLSHHPFDTPKVSSRYASDPFSMDQFDQLGD